jgi:hypothetical protein
MAWLRGVERASTWSPASRFVISSKPPVITADLFGVWSAASDDVWAVGAAGTILHYSGTWSIEPSPTTMALRSVWTAGRGWTWAVGEAGTILRRNGNHWTTTASPTTNSLTGVWASAPSDAWAVGGGTIV